VRRALPAAVEGADFAAALTLFLDLYYERCVDETRPYPGIAEALATLAAQVPLAVLTNKPQRHSRRLLAGLGLDRWLAPVVAGDTLATRKPDPGGLLAIAGGWGLPPASLVLVGDSGVDVATAAAAGSRMLLVEWGFGGRDPLGGYDGPRVAAPSALPEQLMGCADGGPA
jgi:phosphoglycolate phosphatase